MSATYCPPPSNNNSGKSVKALLECPISSVQSRAPTLPPYSFLYSAFVDLLSVAIKRAYKSNTLPFYQMGTTSTENTEGEKNLCVQIQSLSTQCSEYKTKKVTVAFKLFDGYRILQHHDSYKQ